MNRIDEIVKKRCILLTTRLRFSPEIQPVKEAAMDKIIEQILLSADREKGLCLRDMEEVFASGSGVEAINATIIEASLKRLIPKGKVKTIGEEKHERYRLTKETRNEQGELWKDAQRRFGTVVEKLFENAREGASAYTEPFLRLLCIVFSQLGEEYVRVITGNVKREDFLSSPSLSSALGKIKKEFGSIDHSLFERATRIFFREIDPEYDLVKWNLTQNYYIAKAIGLDPLGISLSEEVFKDAVFYLDTNIIISALEERDRNHRTSLALSKACKQLSVRNRVCRISLDEMASWIGKQREVIKEVEDQIPDELAINVNSVFYQIYHEKKKNQGTVSFDEVFSSFKSPVEDLRSIFGMELEDDPWFDDIRDKPQTKRLSEGLRLKYSESHLRKKTKSAALHDAMLLLRIRKTREENHHNIWLITLDKSLPGPLPGIAGSHSSAITLDAFLQWVSPVIVGKNAYSDFTTIFAEMIKNRLFPPENIFNIGYFRVFSAIGMECKNLPPEDVRGCIEAIVTKVPELDPGDPVDREKLAGKIKIFFADPSRKYKQELDRRDSEIKRLDTKLTKLQSQFSEYKEETREESLKKSAKFRLGITIFIFFVLEAIVILLATSYAEGANLFQKLLASWPFLSAVPLITTLIGCFCIGKKRLRCLGWPFTIIFKHK